MSRRIAVAGLIATAVGIWIQAFSGAPEYPTIPPGPIILVVVALIVAFGGRWRPIPILGAALSGLILVGAFVRPETRRHLNAPEIGVVAGTIVQMIGLVMGLFGGLAATVQAYRTGRPSEART